MRATTSFAFPGANGMIAVMFRVGHDCATAALGAAMQSSAKIVRLRARRKISHETFIGRLRFLPSRIQNPQLKESLGGSIGAACGAHNATQRAPSERGPPRLPVTTDSCRVR